MLSFIEIFRIVWDSVIEFEFILKTRITFQNNSIM